MQKLRLLLTLAATMLFATTTMARADSNAANTVNAFYNTYLNGHPGWTNLSRTRQYFTPSLYSQLRKVADMSQHEEVLDFDPFIHAQEYAQSFSVLNTIGSGSRVTVPVLIRYRGGGQQRIRAVVVQTSSGWKIDNLIYPDDNLRHALEQATK